MERVKNSKSSGFTLTELLVSVSIGMIALAAVTTTFMSQTKFYGAQEQVNEMEQNARGALDIITREVKMAGYKPNGGSFSGIVYSTTQLFIQADLDANATISTSSSDNEQITYTYDSTNKQIMRALGSGSAQVVADHITAFTFSYLKSDGTTASTTADIRQVAISITAQTAKPDPNYSYNGGYRTYDVSATITPANLAL